MRERQGENGDLVGAVERLRNVQGCDASRGGASTSGGTMGGARSAQDAGATAAAKDDSIIICCGFPALVTGGPVQPLSLTVLYAADK